MREPTTQDIDALIGPATPHFAYQIRERVERLVEGLPGDHPVRVYAAQRLSVLDALGYGTSRAEGGDPSAPQHA
ncbi:MAG: hypothetical protein QOH00_15 [Gaiellales bacterium]|jgi:hypothetical protein|nr:hypothetical protein [Gaiellales bacterium]